MEKRSIEPAFLCLIAVLDAADSGRGGGASLKEGWLAALVFFALGVVSALGVGRGGAGRSEGTASEGEPVFFLFRGVLRADEEGDRGGVEGNGTASAGGVGGL